MSEATVDNDSAGGTGNDADGADGADEIAAATVAAAATASPAPAPATPPRQARNPLHGITLEAMVTELVDHYGWAGLGDRIQVNSFTHDPSIRSSLKFLRKTPWAREKVESLYLFMRRERMRAQRG